MIMSLVSKQKTAYEMLRSLVGKQKTAYEMLRSLVGSEMCIRDRLWPLLAAPPAGRVVVLSSLAARTGRLKPSLTRDDLVAPRSYAPIQVYGNTKQANLLFAQELQRRLAAAGSPVRAIAVHPGVSSTNLFPRQLTDTGLGWLAPVARSLTPMLLQSPSAGALPTLRGPRNA